MLLPKSRLQAVLKQVLNQRLEQGCDLDPALWQCRIEAAGTSYDALHELAQSLRDPPVRSDWPYREPLTWAEIRAESPDLDPVRSWTEPDWASVVPRVSTGFLASCCGCMLGKPVEIDPTLAQLRAAGEATAQWPLANYVTTAFLEALGRRHGDWAHTVRESLDRVVADDDIHYTVIGLLLLEEHGTAFGRDELEECWSINMAPAWTWGAERSALLAVGLRKHHLFEDMEALPAYDPLLLNPGDESCGALIRADAYGYACPGNPDLAAWLAWKDASCTHIKTGVYGAMFVAALLALALVTSAPAPGNARLELVVEALRRVPARSRFAGVVGDCLERVRAADDWLAGYEAVHDRYPDFTHCRIYQEIGTLINTLKFAESVGHGICLQVSQGNDTDSFGATAGALLGSLLGPDCLESRWLEPFGDRAELALAGFHETSLNRLAQRVAVLPDRVYQASRVG